MPSDPESLALVRRYVVRSADRPGEQRFLTLMGRNPLHENAPGREAFDAALAEDARLVSDDELRKLLSFEWRSRLTAAWLIGLDRRTLFRPTLAELLLDSELVNAGQGYCFALARFGQPQDADILITYLDRYLPRPDCHYDQDWAIGALTYLDDRLGTDHADRFLTPGGAWHRSAFAARDPAESRRRVAGLCALADRIMTIGRC